MAQRIARIPGECAVYPRSVELSNTDCDGNHADCTARARDYCRQALHELVQVRLAVLLAPAVSAGDRASVALDYLIPQLDVEAARDVLAVLTGDGPPC